MSSIIFNFDLKLPKNEKEVVIDITNGNFINENEHIYYIHTDDLSSDIITDNGSGALMYKNNMVGAINYPNKCSINLSKLDKEIKIL